MQKKTKKAMSMLLVVVLIAVIAVGGMLAYLTDRDSKANVFTVGDVEIKLDETFEQGSTLTPGVQVEKEVKVQNTGSNDAWVWYTITYPKALDYEAINSDLLWTGFAKENHDNAGYAGANDGVDEWLIEYTGAPYLKEFTADDGTEMIEFAVLYQQPLKAGETTPVSLKSVYLDKAIDVDPNGQLYKVVNGNATKIDWNIKSDGNPVVYVSAYAMQVEQFDTVEEAYTAYQTQWGDNGSEYGEVPTIFAYEGVNYITDGKEAYANSTGGDTIYRGVFSDGKTNATSVTIGEGITRLNNRALCKAPTITDVSLPSTLTYIDEGVFQQSGFKYIEVPENVTYIGKTAFGACSDLETIVIKAKDVTFANYVGRDSGALKEVYIYSDKVTFESGSMYFTNAQTGDASKITFYVSNQEVADAVYNASSASRSYGMLIKSLDGATTYYNTLK